MTTECTYPKCACESPCGAETDAQKYKQMQFGLWALARGDNPLRSIMAANMIRTFRIPPPEGDSPEAA